MLEPGFKLINIHAFEVGVNAIYVYSNLKEVEGGMIVMVQKTVSNFPTVKTPDNYRAAAKALVGDLSEPLVFAKSHNFGLYPKEMCDAIPHRPELVTLEMEVYKPDVIADRLADLWNAIQNLKTL